MIPPIQTSLKRRWMKFIATPNAGSKVGRGGVTDARACEIDQHQNHKASIFDFVIRSAERICFPVTRETIKRKPTPSMR